MENSLENMHTDVTVQRVTLMISKNFTTNNCSSAITFQRDSTTFKFISSSAFLYSVFMKGLIALKY